ncbi:MAG: cell division ATP-binding protein FtsE [Pseudobdellovibrio sp.]
MIEFKHVYKTYGADRHTLKDISFNINKGEFVFLTGPSGAGKTTLFKLISAFEKITSGEVFVLGHSLSKLKKGQIPFLRRKIGFVLQNYKLLKNKSVFENIELPLIILDVDKETREKKVSEMIRHVGLESVRDQYPDFLSGGEQQRVAIARALIHDPEIIIADEPTGNLDPELSNTILKLFYEFSKKGMTFLVATHDYRLIDKTKCRLLKVDKGQLVEDSAT